jgi:hypothetical protein
VSQQHPHNGTEGAIMGKGMDSKKADKKLKKAEKT